jgi:hypothetical protein
MIAQIRAELLKIRSTRTAIGLILGMIAQRDQAEPASAARGRRARSRHATRARPSNIVMQKRGRRAVPSRTDMARRSITPGRLLRAPRRLLAGFSVGDALITRCGPPVDRNTREEKPVAVRAAKSLRWQSQSSALAIANIWRVRTRARPRR